MEAQYAVICAVHVHGMSSNGIHRVENSVFHWIKRRKLKIGSTYDEGIARSTFRRVSGDPPD